jgi:hypothetical protein
MLRVVLEVVLQALKWARSVREDRAFFVVQFVCLVLDCRRQKVSRTASRVLFEWCAK